MSQVSGIRYQVSGILILPGELLANGYCKWHPEKKGKNIHEHKTNTRTSKQILLISGNINIIFWLSYVNGSISCN